MKQHTEKQSVEVIGQATSQTFKIKASATSFQILSSGLYSNKIRAIVRELSCNAIDSHKVAGKSHVPFDINLPSALSPFLQIKDFGTGLSHDQVLNLYTTYFESTKSDSDDFIGQLGLGSKSPFSYTNQFTVVSRQAGVSNTYSMYIGEEGVPEVSHLGASETEEDDGITIIIPVKQGDYYKFSDEASYALQYFDPYPNVTGDIDKKQVKYIIKNDTWCLRNEYYSSHSHSCNSYVVQGFVRYPIDADQLRTYEQDDLKLSEEASAILSAAIDFIVPIGLVQVAPSREHLSYDKRTLKNLVEFLNKTVEEISGSLQTMIDQCETMWSARILTSSFMEYGNPFRALYAKVVDKNTKLYHKGIEVSGTINFANCDMTDVIVDIYTKVRFNKISHSSYNKTMCSNSYFTCRESVDSQTKVMFNDVNLTPTKIKEYIKINGTRDDKYIVIRAENKKVDISGKVNSFYDEFGIPSDDVILTSELLKEGSIVIAPRAKSASTVDRKEYQVFNGQYIERSLVDVNSGGIYVESERSMWTPEYNRRNHCPLSYIQKILVHFNVLSNNDFKNIVYVPKNRVKKFEIASNWRNLQTIVDDFFANNYEELAKIVVNDEIRQQYACSSGCLTNITVKHRSKLLSESPVLKLLEEADVYLKNGQNSMVYPVKQFVDNISFTDTSLRTKYKNIIENQKETEIIDWRERYPLLKTLSYSLDDETLSHMIDYINMVDAKCFANDLISEAKEVTINEIPF